MSETGSRTVDELARKDHERNCPDDEPYETLSVQHRHVHEIAALRERARRGVR